MISMDLLRAGVVGDENEESEKFTNERHEKELSSGICYCGVCGDVRCGML